LIYCPRLVTFKYYCGFAQPDRESFVALPITQISGDVSFPNSQNGLSTYSWMVKSLLDLGRKWETGMCIGFTFLGERGLSPSMTLGVW